MPAIEPCGRAVTRAAERSAGQQVGKRVLGVDDERVVREAASAVLEAYGFDVETADSGNHAISAMARANDIDAVVFET